MSLPRGLAPAAPPAAARLAARVHVIFFFDGVVVSTFMELIVVDGIMCCCKPWSALGENGHFMAPIQKSGDLIENKSLRRVGEGT